MSKSKSAPRAATLIAILLLALVVLFSGVQIVSSVLSAGNRSAGGTAGSKTITVGGVDYFPRQDITVLLLMGIDETGPMAPSDSYNNTGEADMIALAVFDEADKSYTVLTLNRDTMLEMPVLGIGGKQAGTLYGQLALAHTYGTGMEDSCENTKKAISDFLGGVQIDYYLSMNMDAVAILNDAVGGVRVTVTEDFSAVDGSLPAGEVLLTGEQALTFIRTRQGVGDQLNLSRMQRHEVYMNGFFEAFFAKLSQNDAFVLQTYDRIAPYTVSDCSSKTLSSFVSRYADYACKDIVSPKGENQKGQTYMEFHVDEEALQQLILRLFYKKK